MALQNVHNQKVEKVPHPTLGNHSENTQIVLVCCYVAFRFQRWIIELKVVVSQHFRSFNLNRIWKSYELKSFHPHSTQLTFTSISFHSSPFTLAPLDLYSLPSHFTQVLSLSFHSTYTRLHLISRKSFHFDSTRLTLTSISFHSSPFTFIPLGLHWTSTSFHSSLVILTTLYLHSHPPYFIQVLSLSLH
jgi:hypothetical protein